MFRERTRFVAQACVKGRLSAAGLVVREFHGNAETVENVHDGLTSLRVERIDETGNEELDVGHASILI
jgi:hypothetical protein